MKNLIILSFTLILFQNNAFAQNYTKIDSIVNSFPTNIRSISNISFLIRKNFDSDSTKARAIYKYVSNTISYDSKLAKKILNNNKTHKIEYRDSDELNKKLQKISFKTAQKTLRRKKVFVKVMHIYINTLRNLLA